ncbi:hypothetical protein H9P43_010165 [Blastocladiella emersonii ATCC 22665]|nr:hypothetical protein H9P43_010165 [Blastocladiella emersonii ATCC 22665]
MTSIVGSAKLPPKYAVRARLDFKSTSPVILSFRVGDFFLVTDADPPAAAGLGRPPNPPDAQPSEIDSPWLEVSDPVRQVKGLVPSAFFNVIHRSGHAHQQAAPSAPNRALHGPDAASPVAGGLAASSGTSSAAPVVYPAVVQFDFAPEQADELPAKQGDHVLVLAHSGMEWVVAKFIGKLGDPGLIPISYLEVRDPVSNRPIRDFTAVLRQGRLLPLKQWKARQQALADQAVVLGASPPQIAPRTVLKIKVVYGPDVFAVRANPGTINHSSLLTKVADKLFNGDLGAINRVLWRRPGGDATDFVDLDTEEALEEAIFLRPGFASALALSTGIQLGAYTYSTVGRDEPTEHYYDLSGSVTHLALVAQAVSVSALASKRGVPHPRVLLLGALSSVWAVRLGTYLYGRVKRTGKDSRFDELKKNPAAWVFPWAAQAVWCFSLQLPLTLAALSAARGTAPRLRALDLVGVAVFAGGLALEWVADRQKDAFKSANPTAPMTSGVFRYSVYANYAGEMSLWWGAFLLAAPAMTSPWMYAGAAAGPLFDALLLLKVSGIPLLEKSAWSKYGNDPKYVEYRAKTATLLPWWPKAHLTEVDLAAVRTLAQEAGVNTIASVEKKE